MERIRDLIRLALAYEQEHPLDPEVIASRQAWADLRTAYAAIDLYHCATEE